MPLLYSHPKYPDVQTPITTGDILYCSISVPLKIAAVAALNAFVWLGDEMETFDWKDECQVQYSSRTTAIKKAQLLRDLHLQKQHGVERSQDDPGYREFQVGDTAWLQCSISEFFAMEPDFDNLALEITEATAATALAIEKRLKKLAQAYLELFAGYEKIDPISGYEARETTPDMHAWGQEVIQRHEHVVAFLRLFVSRCTTEKPPEPPAHQVAHTVTIKDLSTLLVDGVPLKMNRARKAALFTIAALGSDISDEEFALLYNDELYRNPGKSAKYGNIVSQALTGLRRSLPHLRVMKPQPHRTQIRGVKITSEVSETVLEEWLHERTSRG